MSIKIGRLTFNEGPMRPFDESWDGDRGVTLTGIIHSPEYSVLRLSQLHDDILGLPNSLVPVLFDVKSHRNGYYWVRSSKSVLTQLGDQNVIHLVWEVVLIRAGADNEIDIESRLAGPINRLNEFSLVGERWHAPSGGASAYYVGADTPGQVIRTGAEGPIIVYRSLAQTGNPRWYCPIANYPNGRVRVFDPDPVERAGTGLKLLTTVGGMQNSLVRIRPQGATFAIEWHNGTGWDVSKQINLMAQGNVLPLPLAISVLHNEYERCTIRCVWNISPSGRVHVDFTLRRGARFVEILMRANTSMTLGVAMTIGEAATAGSGFIRATSNDGDGNRYVIGSLRTFTSDLVAGSISKASITRLDAIVGSEIDGSSAVAGDQAANLMAQYVGIPDETVHAVRR